MCLAKVFIRQCPHSNCISNSAFILYIVYCIYAYLHDNCRVAYKSITACKLQPNVIIRMHKRHYSSKIFFQKNHIYKYLQSSVKQFSITVTKNKNAVTYTNRTRELSLNKSLKNRLEKKTMLVLFFKIPEI